ncbi:MAG TPA: hypothetical protein PLC80_03110 [Draconibacterium sp.]|nr:hypothetical protein [Draconibacterium sp.]
MKHNVIIQILNKGQLKKFVSVIILVLFFSVSGFSQDTVRIETTRIDTVKIETVRIDTVLVVPVNAATAPQTPAVQNSSQPLQKPLLNARKIYFGGYVNLSVGRYTVIGIEPLVGYKLTPKFSIGGKLSYEYISDKRYKEDYTTSNYGFSIFSRLRVTPKLYTHVEYSAMNYDLYYGTGDNDRKWVPFLFVGGGYSQPISKNTWFTAEVLFDVLQNKNSPYKSWEPFFSVGFGVGF